MTSHIARIAQYSSALLLSVMALALPTVASAQSTDGAPVDTMLSNRNLDSLRIYHAYSASDGKTYIERIDVPAIRQIIGGTAGMLYFNLKPQQVKIGGSTAKFLGDWHYAGDSRHLLLPLQDDLVFDLGDGKLFHLKPGEAMLAEDWTGKGHRSGCWSETHPTCLAMDILIDANPKAIPLRDPPARK